MAGKEPQAAYFYEVDESGKRVHGSKQSARKDKERPMISQRDSRTGKPRKSHSDGGAIPKYDDAVSPATQNVQIKEVKTERRKSAASSTKSPKKSTRPPSAHENRPFLKLATARKDDPSHFGIPTPSSYAPSQMSQPIPLRPRAITAHSQPLRPASYHSSLTGSGFSTGPPLSQSAYWPQVAMPPPSFPPLSPQSSFMGYAATPQAPVDYAMSATPVSTRTLSSRFDAIPRAGSAFGFRDVPQPFDLSYDDGYSSATEGPGLKRASIRVRSKQEDDYERMPPPPRPGILRRTQTDYYADAPQHHDRETRSVYRDEVAPSRRQSIRRNSVSYVLPDEDDRVRVLETANNSRRRTSYYGPSTESTGSSDYDAKLRQAANYQADVAGPAILPLTTDMLKRQQRRQAGSSRSTKSSGSRDESDYRKSATTRTTRSGSGGDDENVTIKVTGGARVTVSGAQIDCADGGEIEIKRQKSLRNGSERGTNSEWGGTQRERIEDQRSRVERPVGRSRISSRSNGSYARATPQWI